MWRVASVVVFLGCGSAPTTGDDSFDPEVAAPLAFEPHSPPQSTSYDIFVAGRGEVVVLANRLSRDGGATWQPSPTANADRVAIHRNILTAYDGGLVRYDLAAEQLLPVEAPEFTAAATWRTSAHGELVVFHPIQNAIAIETAAGWSTVKLPQPTPTDFDPYISDVEHSGSTLVVVSGWGIHRSTNDGATFERIATAAQGRELVARADGTFALLGGATTIRFDAAGAIVGDSPGIAVGTQDAKACEDGAILVRDRISRDGGASWQPFLAPGALALTVERFGCGAGYWLLGHSPHWGYRLLHYATPDAEGVVVGNWDAAPVAWSAWGPRALRTTTAFIAAGLAWSTDSASWTVRELPVQAWAIGDTLYGLDDESFYTSHDAGRSWTASATTGLDGAVEAFALAPDGAFHVSQFTTTNDGGIDTWHARVWRSPDGAVWQLVHEGIATREAGENVTGEAHRFVTIVPDGTWVATDATSTDDGATWQPFAHLDDRSLAFVTPSGHLVTTGGDQWHVFELGGALVATWQLEAAGAAVSTDDVRNVTFDDAGYAYVTSGTPYRMIWRSAKPVAN